MHEAWERWLTSFSKLNKKHCPVRERNGPTVSRMRQPNRTLSALHSQAENFRGNGHIRYPLHLPRPTLLLKKSPKRPSDEFDRPPFDNEFLLSSPETAFGSVHSSEFMTESMKVQALEMQEGMHHKPTRDHEIMFQEFLDNMALMASPQSAAGIVSSAGLLDD